MVVSYSLETFYSSLFLRNLLLCSQEPLLNFILAAILLKINSKPTCVISHQCCRCISVPYFSLIYIYMLNMFRHVVGYYILVICLSVCLFVFSLAAWKIVTSTVQVFVTFHIWDFTF